MDDDIYKIQTIRVQQSTNKQLKRFNNFLSDRNNGKFYTQEQALLYLLNLLDESDIEEYKKWLFNEDIQFQTRKQLQDELQKEKEIGEAIFSALCASCQKHAAELVEAIE